MARPSNRHQRRAEIADALIRVIAEVGYDRASVAAIARAAGLRSGLVHYHFDTKQDILLLAVERLAERVERRYLARAVTAGDSALDKLEALVDAHVSLGDGADPTAVAAWVAIGGQALAQPEVRAAYRAVIERRAERIRPLVADCLRDATGSARGARELTAAILGAIEGAYQLSATAPEVLPKGFAAPSIKRMIRGALAAE